MHISPNLRGIACMILASGTFVVESKRPITLLIPLLRELTGT